MTLTELLRDYRQVGSAMVRIDADKDHPSPVYFLKDVIDMARDYVKDHPESRWPSIQEVRKQRNSQS